MPNSDAVRMAAMDIQIAFESGGDVLPALEKLRVAFHGSKPITDHTPPHVALAYVFSLVLTSSS